MQLNRVKYSTLPKCTYESMHKGFPWPEGLEGIFKINSIDKSINKFDFWSKYSLSS